MRWAKNNSGDRILAKKNTLGFCPSCGSKLTPKCGEIITNHWSHKSGDCDSWSEPETKWHINWKQLFPEGEQEVVVENHRADIKTNHCVIELQHSSINPETIREREKFYGRMLWIFDCREAYNLKRITSVQLASH